MVHVLIDLLNTERICFPYSLFIILTREFDLDFGLVLIYYFLFNNYHLVTQEIYNISRDLNTELAWYTNDQGWMPNGPVF